MGELLRLKHRLDLTLHLRHLLRPTRATKAPIGVDRNEADRERHRLAWVPGDQVRSVLCDVQRGSGVRQERHQYVLRVFGMCGKKRGLAGLLRLVAVRPTYRLVQVPAASNLGVTNLFEMASQHVAQFARTCQVGQGDDRAVSGQHRQPSGSKLECLLQITQILHELCEAEVHDVTRSDALMHLRLEEPLLLRVQIHLSDDTGSDVTIQLPAPELLVVPPCLLPCDEGCFLEIPEHDVRDRLVCLAQRPEEGHECCKVEPRSIRVQCRRDLRRHCGELLGSLPVGPLLLARRKNVHLAPEGVLNRLLELTLLLASMDRRDTQTRLECALRCMRGEQVTVGTAPPRHPIQHLLCNALIPLDCRLVHLQGLWEHAQGTLVSRLPQHEPQYPHRRLPQLRIRHDIKQRLGGVCTLPRNDFLGREQHLATLTGNLTLLERATHEVTHLDVLEHRVEERRVQYTTSEVKTHQCVCLLHQHFGEVGVEVLLHVTASLRTECLAHIVGQLALLVRLERLRLSHRRH